MFYLSSIADNWKQKLFCQVVLLKTATNLFAQNELRYLQNIFVVEEKTKQA